MGVRVFLQSRRPVSVAIRCGDMGGYPLHGTDPWGFTRTVGRATDREAATEEVGQEMIVHLSRGGNRGGGV